MGRRSRRQLAHGRDQLAAALVVRFGLRRFQTEAEGLGFQVCTELLGGGEPYDVPEFDGDEALFEYEKPDLAGSSCCG
jgi:hypothetical protein